LDEGLAASGLIRTEADTEEALDEQVVR